MSLSDLDCANFCLAQYHGDAVFDKLITRDGDCCSIKFLSDCTLIAHEGSHDAPNWINNFDAFMEYIPDFGGVEQGFYSGIPEMAQALIPLLPRNFPIYVTGHSRGAARAHILGAMLIKQGFEVEIVVFGSPRPGDAALSAILAQAPNRSYYNYHDIDNQDFVCDVPFDISLIAPFVHPAGRIKLDVSPQLDDPWFILSRHHIELYIEGLKNAEFKSSQ